MSCPHESLLNQYGPPNIKWCEESLCAIVQQPANTWSNLAFVAVGFWILFQARSAWSRVMGYSVVLLGLLSLYYHASNVYITQLGDFLGMFLYLGLLLIWNLRRLGMIAGQTQSILAYFLTVYANIGMLILFPLVLGLPIQLIIFVNTLIVFAMEAFLVRRTAQVFGARIYRDYIVAVVLLGAAAVCSRLDLMGVWCDPTNHWLQGHATWHLLNAASMIFVFRFYSRSGVDRPT
ncbi:MAG: ceramidase domain-containing protein [Leptospirales bacterium]|nr:ceramidase domain-containing protein [Leptospirales bacterium]